MVYDAEHFFDGYARRRRLRAALPARGARGRRRDRRALRHQRRHAARPDRRRRWTRSWPQLGDERARRASTATTTPAAAWPTRWPAWRRAPRHVQGTINGYGERCGNANLVTIIPNLQLKLGLRLLDARAAGARSPRPRTSSTSCSTSRPNPDQPYVGRNAFAHKGGMHVAGVNADPATFEHLDPDLVGNRARAADLRAVGAGAPCRRAPTRPGSTSTTRPPRG